MSKLKQIPNEQLTAELYTDITAAYKTCGYNIPQGKDFADMVTDAVTKFRKYFPNNTLKDIATAFEQGSLGNYGENAGLSVARFYQWMRTFNGNSTNQQPDEEPEETPQQPRDKIQDGHNMVNSAYELWLKRGYNLIPASLLLSWLRNDNLIDRYDERAAEASKTAHENLSKSFERKRERFQKIGDYIRKNQESETESIILVGFFEECKKKGLKKIYQ